MHRVCVQFVFFVWFALASAACNTGQENLLPPADSDAGEIDATDEDDQDSTDETDSDRDEGPETFDETEDIEEDETIPDPCLALEIERGARLCLHTLQDKETFDELSVETSVRPDIAAVTKYILPATWDAYLPPTFQNLHKYGSRPDFLRSAFPEYFGWLTVPSYEDLFLDSHSRRYYAGSVLRLSQTCRGHNYAFTFEQEDSSQANHGEHDVETIAEIQQWLGEILPEDTPLFFPATSQDFHDVETWRNDTVPVYDCGQPTSVEVVREGVSVGYLRLLEEKDHIEKKDDSVYGWQDILVLEDAPSSFIPRVAGIVTQQRRTPFDTLSLYATQYSAPLVFVENALDAFAPYEDKLVKLRVTAEGDVAIEEIDEDFAMRYWEASRPESPDVPTPDSDYFEVLSPLEIPLENSEQRELSRSRFGVGITTLALVGTHSDEKHILKGLTIPFGYYFDFLQTNEITTEIGGITESRTYEEHVRAMLVDPSFQADPEVRQAMVTELSEDMRQHGKIDSERLATLNTRLNEAFDQNETPLRFLFSTNLEAVPAFFSDTFLASRSACECENGEPHLENALRTLWADFWEFEAFEKRWFYRLADPESTAVAVFVTSTSQDVLVSGIAATGLPYVAGDTRMQVHTQIGEFSAPPAKPEEIPETVLLTVSDGASSLEWGSYSSLLEPDHVVSEEQYKDLGLYLDSLRRDFPFDAPQQDDDDVVLALEFDVLPEGEMLVERVGLFHRYDTTERPDQTAVHVETNAELCGRYVDNRDLFEEYKLRTKIELIEGSFQLPTQGELPENPLVRRILFGPEKTELTALDAPRWTLQWADPGDGMMYYQYTFEQTFGNTGNVFSLSYQVRTTAALGMAPDAIEIGEEQISTAGNGWSLILDTNGSQKAISLQSCQFENLPRFTRSALLPSGDRIDLDVRFQQSLLSSGPAALIGATWHRSDEVIEVDDYFRLVYSADHHNWKERFLFVPTESVEGVWGIAVREPYPFDPAQTTVEFLDERQEVLETITPLEYTIEQLSGWNP